MISEVSLDTKMELETLVSTIETLGHYGNIVSSEECLILYNSLLLLQNENHFRKVFFWGRIFGADRDYFIAYGYTKDILLGKTFYYSMNCVDWGLLPKPTEHAKLFTPLCTTKFQGDPALVIDILLEVGDTVYNGKPLVYPQMQQVKEEDRLSATIYYINEEAMAVPRGALFRRPDMVTVENLNFEGLPALEAIEVKTYLHHRVPRQKWNTNLLTRNDYNYAIDFLDTLDIDVPEGCWVVQLCNGGQMAMLKSLYWAGMIFYHFIETPKYGFVYIGHGKKILDLPFMLNPL